MPNIKSSKKDVIRSKIAYEKNKAEKSALKTAVKKFEAALAEGDDAVAEAAYKQAVQMTFLRENTGNYHRCPPASLRFHEKRSVIITAYPCQDLFFSFFTTSALSQ